MPIDLDELRAYELQYLQHLTADRREKILGLMRMSRAFRLIKSPGAVPSSSATQATQRDDVALEDQG